MNLQSGTKTPGWSLCFVENLNLFCTGFNNPTFPIIETASQYLVYPTLLTTITSVGAVGFGEAHHCAVIQQDGSVECWGDNSQLQLGGFVGSFNNTPTKVTAFSEKIVDLSAGNFFTCVVAEVGGTVKCFGAGSANAIEIK